MRRHWRHSDVDHTIASNIEKPICSIQISAYCDILDCFRIELTHVKVSCYTTLITIGFPTNLTLVVWYIRDLTPPVMPMVYQDKLDRLTPSRHCVTSTSLGRNCNVITRVTAYMRTAGKTLRNAHFQSLIRQYFSLWSLRDF